MNAVAAIASLLVAAVAAAAVMRPFRRGTRLAPERLSDPLEDERRSILRSLRELDEERAEGAVTEEDYRSLRHDAEVDIVCSFPAEASTALVDTWGGLRPTERVPSPERDSCWLSREP